MFSLFTFSVLVTAKRRGAQHVHHRCSHSHVSRFVYHTTHLFSFFLSFSILMPNPSRIKSCQKIDPRQILALFPELSRFSAFQAQDFRIYSQEVLEFGEKVSFLLLLPPSDEVCTAPGQNNPYSPRSGFLTLPLQIFELGQFAAAAIICFRLPLERHKQSYAVCFSPPSL